MTNPPSRKSLQVYQNYPPELKSSMYTNLKMLSIWSSDPKDMYVPKNLSGKTPPLIVSTSDKIHKMTCLKSLHLLKNPYLSSKKLRITLFRPIFHSWASIKQISHKALINRILKTNHIHKMSEFRQIQRISGVSNQTIAIL